ncbi:Endoglucanase EG-II [Oleoguttula sp. CCFEE 5521]
MKNSIFAVAAAAGTAAAQGAAYAQCGGQGWSGATTCVSGYTCTYSNPYYSQCLPGSGSGSGASTTKVATTTTRAATSTSSAGGSQTSAPASSGKVQYAGVNIAGFDFGCGTDGTCNTATNVNPGSSGIAQMKHFVTDDGLNAFRLPVGWQYLVNNQLGGTLNSANLANYDNLVQGCLSSGAALCIVDIHNYARWNGGIIGQGGPTNAQFASLWSQLATKYKGNTKIAFGLMNEPHDLNVATWAQSVQAAVTAIRQAGATGNKILLPGSDYTSAAQFISNGSGPDLLAVKNLDGSTTNLIFDVHKYLDSDNSGTHTNCVTDNAAAFQTLGNWLRTNKRQAILSETGGGPNDSSCLQYVCSQLDVLNSYSDVYLGWTGWSAGAFDSTYTLTLTPTLSGGKYTDVPLLTKCIAGKFH